MCVRLESASPQRRGSSYNALSDMDMALTQVAAHSRIQPVAEMPKHAERFLKVRLVLCIANHEIVEVVANSPGWVKT